MRVFEISLLLLNILLLFLTFVLKKLQPKALLFVNAISVVILAIHLLTEGYRWQMFLSYGLVALFFFLSIYRYVKRHSVKEPTQKAKRILIFTLCSIAIIFTAGSGFILPVVSLPKPMGPYLVGMQTFCFADESRDETFTADANDYRKLMVQVWYPAKSDDHVQLTKYIPGGSDTLNKISNNAGIPEIALDYLKYFKTNSYQDAEIAAADGPYPLIILCHGFGTSRTFQTAQAENLASNGYIVAAIDHTYSTVITTFPDGTTTYCTTELKDEASRNTIGQAWFEDVHFILNEFEKLNSGDIVSTFKGKIDTNNVGVAGHSFGGSTAYNAFCNDDRIKAGINLDGSLCSLESHPLKTMNGLNKSFLFLLSEQQIIDRNAYGGEPSDEQLASLETTTKEEFIKAAKAFRLGNDIMQSAADNGGHVISLKGGAHYNFTDAPLISPLLSLMGMTGSINSERSVTLINQCMLYFFNANLKHTDNHMLEVTVAESPDLAFEFVE